MKNLFKDKRVKYGTYSTVVAMIFLAILVMINLVVGRLIGVLILQRINFLV